ncbi:MAG: glutamate--tRNA ligase [Chitinophagaceae bacterium]|nr:glutamate--tRNA ligase [Chitinophagaceae bacterium]MCB9047521.1 glutamate--tRNA ligase [Chitinophagales bacterium]
MSNKVRVRFAPSPTGGLHLGGVRTVLYNYLFARHNGGDFVLRIEDTDRSRYVDGAEQYIYDCLEWCGLTPDEGPLKGGAYAPYRQSERKDTYRQYAEQLIEQGNAYYAFDTPEELERMRNELKTTENPTPQYDSKTRMNMRNSLSLSAEQTKELLNNGTPYVVRIKMPHNETISFTDMIRGDISNESHLVDDKVLLKADGMPTYHLAVVVDDYLMKITHAFRGEEWLPSAPVHILLWRYLGWESTMPQWAHLPLILKPDGHGKLSKRDGQRLGFPVFAMKWTDPNTGETLDGFKEHGFLPEAFVNILAMLGWNDTTEQEVFSMNELIEKFTIDRVHKGGARFDFDKAKWYNHQYLQKKTNEELVPLVQPFIQAHGVSTSDAYLKDVIALVKERCHLLTDFWEQGHFFFAAPETIDTDTIKSKWNEQTSELFRKWVDGLEKISDWNAATLESNFAESAETAGIKKGTVMLPLRIMLVGGKYGPGVFDIAEVIGKVATVSRVKSAMGLL